MKRIRGGSGLGDALYVRPIAEHFSRKGESVTVLSDYRDVFIDADVCVEPFRRVNVEVMAHYAQGRTNKNTTQWDDVCASAKVSVPLRFEWRVRNAALIEQIRRDAAGRPVVLIHGGRPPFGRKDGYGMDLLPEQCAFEAVINALDDCYLVQVGKGPRVYSLRANLDLYDQTSVSDVIDIGKSCDAIVCQCSFAIPLSEVFDKPLLAIWARKGLLSKDLVGTITPQKVLCGDGDAVIDDWPDPLLQMAARGLFR